MISTLMLGTLVIGLLIGVFLLVRFLRKPQNRHPMDGVRERNIGEIERGVPPQSEPTRAEP